VHRRGFLAFAAAELDGCLRETHCGLAIFEIDFFKLVDDRFCSRDRRHSHSTDYQIGFPSSRMLHGAKLKFLGTSFAGLSFIGTAIVRCFASGATDGRQVCRDDECR
jgi:hypothetical protein